MRFQNTHASSESSVFICAFVRFSRVSCALGRFRALLYFSLLRAMIGPSNSRHSLIQSDVKPKPIPRLGQRLLLARHSIKKRRCFLSVRWLHNRLLWVRFHVLIIYKFTNLLPYRSYHLRHREASLASSHKFGGQLGHSHFFKVKWHSSTLQLIGVFILITVLRIMEGNCEEKFHVDHV